MQYEWTNWSKVNSLIKVLNVFHTFCKSFEFVCVCTGKQAVPGIDYKINWFGHRISALSFSRKSLSIPSCLQAIYIKLSLDITKTLLHSAFMNAGQTEKHFESLRSILCSTLSSAYHWNDKETNFGTTKEKPYQFVSGGLGTGLTGFHIDCK